MYTTKAVANYFLDRGKREAVSIDPMKLQKLVYFAHGWHLAQRGRPLVNERAEAWRHGPVFPHLYHHFKEYGRNPIKRPAVKDEGHETWVIEPRIRAKDQETREILDTVWQVYSPYSGYEMSIMTHQKDGPWAKIWLSEAESGRILNVDIPDDLIREYFYRVGTEEPDEHGRAA